MAEKKTTVVPKELPCVAFLKCDKGKDYIILLKSHVSTLRIELTLDMTDSLGEFAAVYKSKTNVNNVCCRLDATHASLTSSSIPSFKLNQC